MKVNRGKDLEAQFKEQVEKIEGVSVDRLPDPTMGFLGVRNIADFAIYYYPFQYYIECKAFSGNTLNFAAGISANQWAGMEEKSKIKGTMAGILAWFIDYDRTVFVPIQTLVKRKNVFKAKSLNIKDLKTGKVEYIEMEGEKKRVFFNYNMEKFMEQLTDYTRVYWQLEKEAEL